MERGNSYVERKMPKYRKTDEMRWRYDSDDCVKIVIYTEETRREKKSKTGIHAVGRPSNHFVLASSF